MPQIQGPPQYDLLFNRATKDNQRNPYEEKAYSGPDYNVVRGKWKQSQWWMWHYKDQRAPEILDIHGFIRGFRRAKYSSFVISSMAPKTSNFFDLKTCLRSKVPHSMTFSLDPPRTIREIPMKRKHTVDPITM